MKIIVQYKYIAVKLIRLLYLIPVLSVLMLLCQCTEEKISPFGTGTIEGRVLDEEDLSPVANAEVTTSPPTHTVLADSTGNFTMEVEAGDYNVIAKKKDYFTSSSTVKVNLNKSTNLILNINKRDAEEDLPWLTGLFFPENNQAGVQVNTILMWQLKKSSDTVDFNLKVYESGHPLPVLEKEIADTFAILPGLKFNTTYLWQVSAKNSSGIIHSDIQSFTTRSMPDDFLLFSQRVNGVSQIFMTDTLGENNIQLTHNNYHSYRPSANEQMTRIAFLSTRDINLQLYTMDMNGGNIRKITTIPTGGFYNNGVGFSWLPNGERLVFSAYNSLYTINHDGTGLRRFISLAEDRHFREVDWSPVGNKIVALTQGAGYYDQEIMLMNTDGSGQEVLVGNMPGALGDPTFSIDGNRILYTYDSSGYDSDPGRQLDARIFQYDLTTGTIEDLSTQKISGTNDLGPRFTEDGSKILFINTQNTVGARKDLWIMNANNVNATHRKKLIGNVEIGD